MERNAYNKPLLADAINCSSQNNFTPAPNQLIRNPEISTKAKIILILLLSNREGWHSCISHLSKMMKEGKTSIQSGIQELEKNGYLLRIKYRNIKTKTWVGSFWAYTDIPWKFEIKNHLTSLQEKGLEILSPEPEAGNPYMGFPDMENRPIKILYNNNTNNNLPMEEEKQIYITPTLFELFWELYPRKIDKGKAQSKWNNICKKKDRPVWKDIKYAIRNQLKSERWQDPKFIPHPTTWLNQSRWLDDPEQMKSSYQSTEKCPVGWIFGKDYNPSKQGCMDCEDNNYKTFLKCKSIYINNK